MAFDKPASADMIVNMEKIYTSQQVADILGRARVSVNQCARKNNIGSKLGPARVFEEADIDKLRALIGGRPGAKEKPGAKYHGWRKKYPHKTKPVPVADAPGEPAPDVTVEVKDV